MLPLREALSNAARPIGFVVAAAGTGALLAAVYLMLAGSEPPPPAPLPITVVPAPPLVEAKPEAPRVEAKPDTPPPAVAEAVPAKPSLAPAATAPRPAFGTLTDVPCPATLIEPARCVHLLAPQNWDAPDAGAVVKVFAAILPAVGADVRSDPVVILSGGPGQAASDEAAFATRILAPMRERRSLILIDQRGTGASVPALYCPAIEPLRFWFGGITAEDAARCLDPIRAAGFRLESFDTHQSVLDTIALRRSLGIAQWNLVATSYGAILAQGLLRDDAPAVRMAILNSPTTAATTWLDTDRFAEIRRIHQTMADDCGAQPSCARRFHGLNALVPRLAQSLTDRPLMVTLTDPRNGRPVSLKVDWRVVSTTVTFRLSQPGEAARVPAMLDYLDRVASGRTELDEAQVADIVMPEYQWRVFDRLAYGLNLTVGCRENRPRINAASARAAGEAFFPYVAADAVETDYDAACPALALPAVGAEFYAPVSSTIPVLILTGAYDTLVPTARSEAIARTLSRHRIMRFRGIGHDVLAASSCAVATAADFLQTGDVSPLRDCAERFLPPAFTDKAIHPVRTTP